MRSPISTTSAVHFTRPRILPQQTATHTTSPYERRRRLRRQPCPPSLLDRGLERHRATRPFHFCTYPCPPPPTRCFTASLPRCSRCRWCLSVRRSTRASAPGASRGASFRRRLLLGSLCILSWLFSRRGVHRQFSLTFPPSIINQLLFFGPDAPAPPLRRRHHLQHTNPTFPEPHIRLTSPR